jgi:tetratricopeptide (TPR) repeat protein
MPSSIRAALRSVGEHIALLWPPYRRRREAQRAARRAQNDVALQLLLLRARMQKLKSPLSDTLERAITPADLLGMHATVMATQLTPDKRVDIVVGAFAKWGLAFNQYYQAGMQEAPEIYRLVATTGSDIIQTWFRGALATSRADEPEARARFALHAARQGPQLARIAANSAFELPPGHELRDERRIRTMLERCITISLDLAAEHWSDEQNTRTQRSSVLNAFAGIIEHGLATSNRMSSLLEIGQRVVDRPDFEDEGRSFTIACAKHWQREAQAARDRGEREFASRCGARVGSALKQLLELTQDPRRSELAKKILERSSLPAERLTEVSEGREIQGLPDRQAKQASLDTTQIFVERLFEAGRYEEIVTPSETILPRLEERYLSAVLEDDIALAGEALAKSIGHVATARAKLGDPVGALKALDGAKSLRFRYQSLLRRSPLGNFLRDLEADIYAVSRGSESSISRSSSGKSRHATSLVELLETYRQAREKVGYEKLIRASVADIAGTLLDDEAAIVLGDLPEGFLLAIICPGDADVASYFELLGKDAAAEFDLALIHSEAGWYTSRAFGADLAEPKRSLVHGLAVADRILGRQISAALQDTEIRRLTIIPHKFLHLVPFWALPSLSRFQIMTAASASQLVSARTTSRELGNTSLVVGNPTGDLELAAAEARRVSKHLRELGCEVAEINGEDARTDIITTRIRGRSILHFSGHGRSDLSVPARSALELHPSDKNAVESPGGDLLLQLAEKAEWRDIYRLAGSEWIPMTTEKQAHIAGRGRLEERFWPSRELVELRLDYSPKGTLLGQYRLNTDKGGAKYGARLRLSELWSAGDILIDGALADCGFAFLSSCEVGMGGVNPHVDEFSGLPAALQLAGVTTVVSPLWPVDVEMAAVFTELFYAALAEAGREVDVRALVHRARHRLRTITRDEAAALLGALSTESLRPKDRLFLDAVRIRLQNHEELLPFSHPYHWAAFQAIGAPSLRIPYAPKGDGAEIAAVPTATQFQLPDDPPVSVSAREAPDVFALADAAILLQERRGKELNSLATESLLNRGSAHLREGREEDAKADFLKVLEIDQQNVAARYELARQCTRLGESTAAMLYVNEIIALDVEHAAARLMRGLLREKIGEKSAALDDLKRLVSHPDVTIAGSALAARSRLLEGAGNRGAALADLDEAIRLRPELSMNYLQRAHLRYAQGQWDAVVADATRTIVLDPAMPAVHLLRGLALRELKQNTEAIRDFEKAVKLDDKCVEALIQLAGGYGDLNEHDLALQIYDRAALQAPDRPEIFTNRGLVRAAKGEYDLAVADHERALSIDPSNPAALYNRACALSLKQTPGTIVPDLQAALHQDPELRDHALGDPDLEWARRHFREVRQLLDES